MTGPVFGVMIATHNRLSLLRRAIASLEAQTYQSWLAVIVDDSSNSETFLWRNETDLDSRMSYVRNPSNLGAGASWNRAMDLLLGQADFVLCLGDDDFLKPTSLASAAEAIADHPNDRWFMSRHIDAVSLKPVTRVEGSETSFCYWTDVLLGPAVSGDAVHIIATELIASTGARFPESRRSDGEWRFFAQLGSQSRVRFFEGGETVGEYLEGGLSDMARQDLSGWRDGLREMAEVGRSLDLAPRDRAAAERYLSLLILRHVLRFAKAGDLRGGRSLLRSISYRTAMRSLAFYRGLYLIAAATVAQRQASLPVGSAERRLLAACRDALRRARNHARWHG